jgi:photosystem II stability/assembly factor-like uncharacterized protein
MSMTPSPALQRIACLLVAGALACPAAAPAFNDIETPDGIYVMAVGDTGRIVRSWNGGAFWSGETFGSANLHALEMDGELALMAGSGGRIWRSTDAGGTWAEQIPAGSGDFHGLDLHQGALAVAVGAAGRVVRSVDGGVNWSAVSSPVTRTLRAVRLRDAARGYAVGDSGTVLRSGDGGASWQPLAVGANVDLLDVDCAGDAVWVVGRGGAAWRSLDEGDTWERIALGLPEQVSVDLVRLASPDTVWLAGGGGFVRRSLDGGATWTFGRQPLLGAIGGLHVRAGGDSLLAALRTSPAVVISDDGGLTWAPPAGTTDVSRWINARPYTSPVRGNTIARNAQQPNGLFAAIGDSLYRSGNRGVTWTPFNELPPVNKTNAFLVSPYDTMVMIAAVDAPDRLVRSVDGGVQWTTVLARDFSEFGTPLEMDEARPDTLLFAPENGVLYRSFDFGASWDSLSSPGFRSPCDVLIVPANPLNIWVGDGITGMGFGQVFQSLDGGLTFTQRFVSNEGSEIPALTVAPLAPNVGLATQWSRGGVARTLDGGATWSSVSTAQTAWGAAFAPDDPNVVAFGLFATGLTYFSTTQAANFLTYPINSSNYSLFSLDRGTYFATQTTGLHRFVPGYRLGLIQGSFLSLVSPNGGEQWQGGETREIRWDSFGLFRVLIEFSPDFGTEFTPLAIVPAYLQTYVWRIPPVVASSARIRISPVWGGTQVVESQNPFTLSSSFLTLTPGVLDMGSVVPEGLTSRTVTFGNPGNLPLDVLSISPPLGPQKFFTSRFSFSIPPFGSDTLVVYYRPNSVRRDTTTFVITTNDPESPHQLVAFGAGLPAAFTVAPAAPNPVRDRSLIRYALPAAAHVRLEVFNLSGQRVATLVDGTQPAGEYAVPFGPGVALGRGIGASALPAGVYFYRFRAGTIDVRRKMVVLK